MRLQRTVGLLFAALWFALAPSRLSAATPSPCRGVQVEFANWIAEKGVQRVASKYHVTAGRQLGEGGYGRVYRGTAPTDLVLSNGSRIKAGDPIAVKFSGLPEDRELRTRENLEMLQNSLKNEIEIAKALGKSHRFLGMSYAARDKVLLVEYLPNAVPLEEYAKTKKFDRAALETVENQLREALLELKARQIVHGDLHESNILVIESANGLEIKIIDFGLSAFVGGYPLQTANLKVRGGRKYTSRPEQYDKNDPADFADDEFAITKILNRLDLEVWKREPHWEPT